MAGAGPRAKRPERILSLIDELATELAARLPGAVARDVSVAELTTYRIGGPCRLVVRAADEATLATVATVLGEHGEPAVPILVIGRGSNLLVADEGFAGIGIVLTGEFEAIDVDRASSQNGGVGIGGAEIRAGGGVALPVLARQAATAGWSGLEFYVGIPGSVGGAVAMNAGGHGRETAEVVHRVWTIDLLAGTRTGLPIGTRERSVESLELGYRHCALELGEVVTGAEFVVTRDEPEACEDRLREIVRWRREHQPGGSNAGSVFRNPPGDAAGRLIDAIGCRGLRIGGAQVSEKHANFFQAEPGATATDVHALVREVQRRVEDATGVHLVPELRLVGFGEDGS